MQTAETCQSAHLHLWGRLQLQLHCKRQRPERLVPPSVTDSRAGKLAGLDKKLSNNLEDTVKESSSPVELSKSPVGPLADPTRWVPYAAGGTASIPLPAACQGLGDV